VSILLHPLAVGSAPVLVTVTGTDGSIGGHACSCSQVNAWRY
jgi:hypothetical protein